MRQGQQKRMRGRNRGPGGSSSGGKGPNNGNDQYAGEIDNVFLTIGD